jgi:hypothetical protein
MCTTMIGAPVGSSATPLPPTNMPSDRRGFRVSEHRSDMFADQIVKKKDRNEFQAGEN